jgi:hypothetical protein
MWKNVGNMWKHVEKMWKNVETCGKMWKHVENEEMEKYGMVIINEKKTRIESPFRFHPMNG